jgi:hypothetical protein
VGRNQPSTCLEGRWAHTTICRGLVHPEREWCRAGDQPGGEGLRNSGEQGITGRKPRKRKIGKMIRKWGEEDNGKMGGKFGMMEGVE